MNIVVSFTRLQFRPLWRWVIPIVIAQLWNLQSLLLWSHPPQGKHGASVMRGESGMVSISFPFFFLALYFHSCHSVPGFYSDPPQYYIQIHSGRKTELRSQGRPQTAQIGVTHWASPGSACDRHFSVLGLNPSSCAATPASFAFPGVFLCPLHGFYFFFCSFFFLLHLERRTGVNACVCTWVCKCVCSEVELDWSGLGYTRGKVTILLPQNQFSRKEVGLMRIPGKIS